MLELDVWKRTEGPSWRGLIVVDKTQVCLHVRRKIIETGGSGAILVSQVPA